MQEETSRTLGRHEAEIEQLQKDMLELKRDVRAIREILDQARGGWKTLALVAGIAGALGALLQKIISTLQWIVR